MDDSYAITSVNLLKNIYIEFSTMSCEYWNEPIVFACCALVDVIKKDREKTNQQIHSPPFVSSLSTKWTTSTTTTIQTDIEVNILEMIMLWHTEYLWWWVEMRLRHDSYCIFRMDTFTEEFWQFAPIHYPSGLLYFQRNRFNDTLCSYFEKPGWKLILFVLT